MESTSVTVTERSRFLPISGCNLVSEIIPAADILVDAETTSQDVEGYHDVRFCLSLCIEARDPCATSGSRVAVTRCVPTNMCWNAGTV